MNLKSHKVLQNNLLILEEADESSQMNVNEISGGDFDEKFDILWVNKTNRLFDQEYSENSHDISLSIESCVGGTIILFRFFVQFATKILVFLLRDGDQRRFAIVEETAERPENSGSVEMISMHE